MKKFYIIVIAATAIILLTPKNYPLPSNLTYYWGNGCSHCKNVEDFLSTWGKKDKVTIEKKEVWGNIANAKEMEARYKSCNITDPKDMGVPLLFTPDGKCFDGDEPIIQFLKELNL